MSEWSKTILRNHIDKVVDNRGKNPPYMESGYPVIETGCISGNNKFPNLSLVKKYVDQETYDSWFRSGHPEQGDLLIITVGNGIGSCAIYKNGNGCITQNLIGIRPIKEELSSEFLYYYLSQNELYDFLQSLNIGSAQPSLKVPHILGLEIPYPPLLEQKAIASVLSSLDDKIDLLHRQNKTLEAMAETLFRQWLIEEAKEDWHETKVLEVFSLVGGGTPKTSEANYWDGDIPWLSGGDIANAHQGFIVKAEKAITELGLEKSSTKLLPKLASVISARGTVGKYAMLSRAMTFSQSNYGIVPKGHTHYYFVYLLLAYIVDELSAAAYGSEPYRVCRRLFYLS